MDNLLDILFVIDIIVMFFTSYQTNKGDEIKDSVDIARNYISSRRFYFDTLSIFGSSVFSNQNKIMKVFGFFKMARVTRLNNYINKLNITLRYKAVIQFLKYSFYLILNLHI